MANKPKITNREQQLNKQVLQLDPEMVKIFQQGLSSHQSGQLALAKAAYEQVLLKNPKHYDALYLLGVVATQTKNPALAAEFIGKAIEINPNPDAFYNRGIVLQELKQLDDALASFDKAIALEPNFADALNNRGTVLQELKRLDDALTSFDKAIVLEPNFADAFYNRGIVLQELKHLDDALASFDKAIVLEPNFADAFYNRGTVLQELKRLEDALASFDKAISLKPDFAEAFYNRGTVLQELKQLEDALASYDKVISLKPDSAKSFNNRGTVLQELKRLEDALESYDKAVALQPDSAKAFNNRGNILKKLKRLVDALASYDKAIALEPNFAEAFYNRGIVLNELKHVDDAIASYDKAIALEPDHFNATWNKSLLLLLTGRYHEGWLLYESRLERDETKSNYHKFLQPSWLGVESIKDKTILLYSEQGLGDTIQFCRYAPLVAELGATVILEVQRPLVNLLKNLEGVSQVFAKNDNQPEFNYHCPLLSLPLAFKTEIKSIPSKIPYIHTEPDRDKNWAQYLGKDGFKIAVSWEGSQKGKEEGRTFPLHLFESIAKIKGVRLISIQKNTGIEQLKNLPLGMMIETLPDDFDAGENAFLDSASIMKAVDLVITCDTSLTHLSGAIGIRTWLPLANVPDWRWMLDRNDSPWYPNHTLFRQEERGDWGSVFKKMEIELKKLIVEKKEVSLC
jgi:tetratricopeptide (TPR) repeat protein